MAEITAADFKKAYDELYGMPVPPSVKFTGSTDMVDAVRFAMSVYMAKKLDDEILSIKKPDWEIRVSTPGSSAGDFVRLNCWRLNEELSNGVKWNIQCVNHYELRFDNYEEYPRMEFIYILRGGLQLNWDIEQFIVECLDCHHEFVVADQTDRSSWRGEFNSGQLMYEIDRILHEYNCTH